MFVLGAPVVGFLGVLVHFLIVALPAAVVQAGLWVAGMRIFQGLMTGLHSAYNKISDYCSRFKNFLRRKIWGEKAQENQDQANQQVPAAEPIALEPSTSELPSSFWQRRRAGMLWLLCRKPQTNEIPNPPMPIPPAPIIPEVTLLLQQLQDLGFKVDQHPFPAEFISPTTNNVMVDPCLDVIGGTIDERHLIQQRQKIAQEALKERILIYLSERIAEMVDVSSTNTNRNVLN